MIERFKKNIGGASALEFALLAPLFFSMMMGIIEGGLLLWMQLALQQGVEAAARCASVNSAICGNSSQIQAYAAAQSEGMSLPANVFTVSTASCGNMVRATYTPTFLPTFPIPARTLTAQACFPI